VKIVNIKYMNVSATIHSYDVFLVRRRLREMPRSRYLSRVSVIRHK